MTYMHSWDTSAGILNAVGESYGLGSVALGDGHPPGHAVGKAED